MKKKNKHREVDQATKIAIGHCLHIIQPTGFRALILNQQGKL